MKSSVNAQKIIELNQQSKEFYDYESGLTVKKKGNFTLFRFKSDDDHFHPNYSQELNSCRGLVINHVDQKVICYPWNNKLPFDIFKKKYSFSQVSKVSPLIDGTMINLFYDESCSENTHGEGGEHWHFSTATCVDAKDSRWHSCKSFETMFYEILPDINYSSLNQNYCYSFVIQHKDNRIVVPIDKNRLILTLVRDMTSFEDVTDQVDVHSIGNNVDKVSYLTKHDWKSYEELESSIEDRFDFMGYMIHSHDGFRTRIRNPSYNHVSQLRGSAPNKWTNYLFLFHSDLYDEYLTYYPEEEDSMNRCLEGLNKCIKYIFELYRSIYMNRVYSPIPFYLKKVMNQIHKIYLDRKKTMEHPSITHKVVKGVFHQLPFENQTKIIRNFLL